MSATKTKAPKQDIDSVMRRLYKATFENQQVLLISGSGAGGEKNLVMKPTTWPAIVRIADYIYNITNDRKVSATEKKNKFLVDVFEGTEVPEMYLFNDLGCIMSKTAYKWFSKEMKNAKKTKALQFKPLAEEDDSVESASRATIALYEGMSDKIRARLLEHEFKADAGEYELIASAYPNVFTEGKDVYNYTATSLTHQDNFLALLRDLKLRALDAENIREETKEYLTAVKAHATGFQVKEREKRTHENVIKGTTMSEVFASAAKLGKKESKTQGDRQCYITLGYHPLKMKVVPHVAPVNVWPKQDDSKARTFHRSVKSLFSKKCNVGKFDWDTFLARMKSDIGSSKSSIAENLESIYLSGIAGVMKKKKPIEAEMRVVSIVPDSKPLALDEYRYDVGMIIFAAYLIRYKAFNSAKYLLKCLRKAELGAPLDTYVEKLGEDYDAATNAEDEEEVEEKPKKKKSTDEDDEKEVAEEKPKKKKSTNDEVKKTKRKPVEVVEKTDSEGGEEEEEEE